MLPLVETKFEWLIALVPLRRAQLRRLNRRRESDPFGGAKLIWPSNSAGVGTGDEFGGVTDDQTCAVGLRLEVREKNARFAAVGERRPKSDRTAFDGASRRSGRRIRDMVTHHPASRATDRPTQVVGESPGKCANPDAWGAAGRLGRAVDPAPRPGSLLATKASQYSSAQCAS